jgi:hypothetical protein
MYSGTMDGESVGVYNLHEPRDGGGHVIPDGTHCLAVVHPQMKTTEQPPRRVALVHYLPPFDC